MPEAPATEPRSNVTTMGWAAFWSGMAQEMIYPLLPIFLIVALSSSKTASASRSRGWPPAGRWTAGPLRCA
jgi:hypothetical protein